MIGPLLIVGGLLAFWAVAMGKAGPVIDAIVGTKVTSTIDQWFGTDLIPAETPASGSTAGTSGPASNAVSGAAGNGTSLFTVPINGPNGSGPGSITVVAHDLASALQNAKQGGNIPTGDPVPAMQEQ